MSLQSRWLRVRLVIQGGSTFSAKARQLRYQTLIKAYLARRNIPKL